MRIYIDITGVIKASFLTGIQRVVTEFVKRALNGSNDEIILLANTEKSEDSFRIVRNEAFLECLLYADKQKADCVSVRKLDVTQLQPNSVFLDIDSVWNTQITRNFLYPLLKKLHIRVVTLVYDIIPITTPYYSHQDTVYHFMKYIGAVLQYSNMILVNTNQTANRIKELQEVTLTNTDIQVIPLGSDFQNDKKIEPVDPGVKVLADSLKYILMVGTIEPRKNHTLVLDAYDQALRKAGIGVIIAGRVGWNVEVLSNRIQKHPYNGKSLFHFQGLNDTTIDYLYRHAYFTVFPTFDEGYGLPIIESIERNTPVLASNREVLHEVGGKFIDYFNPDDPQDLIGLLDYYLNDPEAYQKKVEGLKNFRAYSWDDISVQMLARIHDMDIIKNNALIPTTIKQIVYLSARPNDLLPTLPYIENFMPFIREIVICCPCFVLDEFKNGYSGALPITFITDDELLDGRPLPQDHGKRNFLLRCLAMRHAKIDTQFIMSDDDYRPLLLLTEDIFIKSNKYQAYYCYDLTQWVGDFEEPSSYDNYIFRTADFCLKNGFTTYQFSSHMPQIINKHFYREMLDEFLGLEETGCDEWSSYFNYMIARHPDAIEVQAYVTMGWPAAVTDWEMCVKPPVFLFENFYKDMYDTGKMFEGFSPTYNEGTLMENFQKINRYRDVFERHENSKAIMRSYESLYQQQNREKPVVTLYADEQGKIQIKYPDFLMLMSESCVKLPIHTEHLPPESMPATVCCAYLENNGVPITDFTKKICLTPKRSIFPILCHLTPGEYRFAMQFEVDKNKLNFTIPLVVV